MNTRARLPAHMKMLLDALAEPWTCSTLGAAQLDILVRTARQARLLGVLAARIERAGCGRALPLRVGEHLHAARAEARHSRQMVLRQLGAIGETLRPLDVRPVALKGAAYVLMHRRCAAGRSARDVDVLVPHAQLGDVERALLDAGWRTTGTDPHEQRHHREWAQKLPPMRAPTMPLALELHHALLPPHGRVRPDMRELLSAIVPAGDGGWWSLSTADQVLHAAADLFQDSDCAGRLRKLVDIDALVREALIEVPEFFAVLGDRARRLRLEGPLWYALELSRTWLRLPVNGELLHRLAAPPWPARRIVLGLARRCLTVTHPEAEPGRLDRMARGAMALRAQWLRVPLPVLARQATRRFRRASALAQPANRPAEGSG